MYILIIIALVLATGSLSCPASCFDPKICLVNYRNCKLILFTIRFFLYALVQERERERVRESESFVHGCVCVCVRGRERVKVCE